MAGVTFSETLGHRAYVGHKGLALVMAHVEGVELVQPQFPSGLWLEGQTAGDLELLGAIHGEVPVGDEAFPIVHIGPAVPDGGADIVPMDVSPWSQGRALVWVRHTAQHYGLYLAGKTRDFEVTVVPSPEAPKSALLVTVTNTGEAPLSGFWLNARFWAAVGAVELSWPPVPLTDGFTVKTCLGVPDDGYEGSFGCEMVGTLEPGAAFGVEVRGEANAVSPGLNVTVTVEVAGLSRVATLKMPPAPSTGDQCQGAAGTGAPGVALGMMAGLAVLVGRRRRRRRAG
jgi:MYXO-CTERM domain-containing protein